MNIADRDFIIPLKNLPDEKRRFNEWDKASFLAVNEYLKLLKKWREDYAPKNMDEAFHPLFNESLRETSITEYLLDILTFGSHYEKLSLWKNNKDMIHRISYRVKAFEPLKAKHRR